MGERVPDSRPDTSYFVYQGEESGVVCTPLLGEVQNGTVYAVTDPETVAVLQVHPHYRAVSQRDYLAQNPSDKEYADA